MTDQNGKLTPEEGRAMGLIPPAPRPDGQETTSAYTVRAATEDEKPGGTPDPEQRISDESLATMKDTAESNVRRDHGLYPWLASETALALIEEVQKYRAADAATPSTPAAPRMSARLDLCVSHPGKHAIVLRPTAQDARETLYADARRLVDLGYEDFMAVQNSAGRIKLDNGSRLTYIGGDERYLDQRVRGMRADHLDGGHLIDNRAAHFIVRPAS